MAEIRSTLQLRPATIDDTGLVADLETACTPDDPRDGVMIAFWWTHQPGEEKSHRLIAERDGVAIMYVSASYGEWKDGSQRFGSIRLRLHPDDWRERTFLDGLERAEGWLRAEGTETSFVRIRQDFKAELSVVGRVGYHEVRRTRIWHLDLVRGRERLLAAAAKTRAEMERQGVRLLTLDQDTDPDNLKKLYALDMETTDDVPKTVPWPVPSFEEWSASWFDNPGHRRDRFWIAREGDAIVGLSVIGYPPRRGIPWTSFTGAARAVRGRGIARALKHETIAQAIALGAELVETANDAENAPILHLNEEMGYEPGQPLIELHRELAT